MHFSGYVEEHKFYVCMWQHRNFNKMLYITPSCVVFMCHLDWGYTSVYTRGRHQVESTDRWLDSVTVDSWIKTQ